MQSHLSYQKISCLSILIPKQLFRYCKYCIILKKNNAFTINIPHLGIKTIRITK